MSDSPERSWEALTVLDPLAPLVIRFFGPFEVRVNGTPLPRLRAHKGGALLALLILRSPAAPGASLSPREVERQWLAGMLWPDCATCRALATMRRYLTDLRHALGPEAWRLGSPTSHSLTLDLTGAAADVLAFDAAMARGGIHPPCGGYPERSEVVRASLEQAVALYRGPLLEGWVEEWVFEERQAREQAYLQALERLAAGAMEHADLDAAEWHLRRAVGVDPLRESAQRRLMQVLAAGGNYAAATQLYRELRLLLHRELNLEPAPETRSLYEAIRAEARCRAQAARPPASLRSCSPDHAVPGAGPHNAPSAPPAPPPHAGLPVLSSPAATPLPDRDPAAAPAADLPLPADFPPLTAVDSRSNNLLTPLTPLIGRQQEIARLRELLGQGVGDWGLGVGAQGSGSEPPIPIPNPQPPTPNARLVTLTGPGGSGKTRLAQAVAARLWPAFEGAVWFVPLADVSDPRLIVDKLLDALSRYRSAGADLWEQVTAFLLRQPSLLVLDNFEHLVSEGALVVRSLLDQVPTVTVLVTSRQRLGLAGERQFPVAPLPVPEEGVGGWASGVGNDDGAPAGPNPHRPTPNALAQCPSVQLFVERAQAVRPDFQLTPANAAAVASLCRQLEGLPLALELAAARVGVLTPAQILARLKPRFELLVSRQRDLAPRHRSLWAALDWSYQHLSPELQRFFARLSIFRGGWTLEAAEAVCEAGVRRWALGVGERGCDATPNAQRLTPALDCLEQLRECSLVLAEEEGAGVRGQGSVPTTASVSFLTPDPSPLTPGAAMRYRMLETLREYGAEQLTPAERDELARRHALYYLSLAEATDPELTGPDQLRWLERLEQEHDNFRAALDGCVKSVDSGQWLVVSPAGSGPKTELPLSELTTNHYPLPTAVETGLRLGGALAYFWEVRGYWAEGRERLKQLLALPGAETRTIARAKVLRFAGYLTLAHSEPEAARDLLAASLAIYREQGDLLGAAEVLIGLGSVAACSDDYDAARAFHEESLAISRSLGSQGGMARALFSLSEVARGQGDLLTAVSLAQHGLGLFREVDDRRRIADALVVLAVMVHHQGDYTGARAYLEEGLAIARELGDKRGIAGALLHLGGVLRCLGEYETAAAAYQESLGLWRELGDEWCVAGMLSGLGIAALRQGDYRQALALFTDSITRYRELSSRPSTTRHDQELSLRFSSLCLAGVAEVAAAMGQPERAARLLGAAEAALEAAGADLWPAERTDYELSAAAVREAMRAEAFAAAWAEGRALPFEPAVHLALEEEPPLRCP